MLKTYPQLHNGDLKNLYKKLEDKEQKTISSYIDYRKVRGLNSERKLDDVKRIILQIRNITKKPLENISYDELLKLVGIIKNSEFGDYHKNEILTTLKRFLKWKVDNWSSKLKLDDISLIKNPVNERVVTHKELLSKADIEKLMKHETKMFWKAFLITQYEAGLRTKETRFSTWENMDFNKDDDLTEIKIFSSKTKKTRFVYVKEATFYLKKLREEQRNLGIESVFVFPSKRDVNKPVSQALISMWFKRLCKRVLGRDCWNYILRHSRGNELYQMTKKGTISKDIALSFMGHSKEMSKVYTHDKATEIKKMMREQVYHLEDVPKEKKIELLKEIENLKERLAPLEKDKKKFNDFVKEEVEKAFSRLKSAK